MKEKRYTVRCEVVLEITAESKKEAKELAKRWEGQISIYGGTGKLQWYKNVNLKEIKEIEE